MDSSIYISSEKIEAIGYSKSGGKVAVKDYATYPLPEGTMINGLVIDHACLTEGLAALKREKPKLFAHPSLIVDGSAILSKRIVAPKLKKHQYEHLVRDEFADSADNAGELTYAYYPAAKYEGRQAAILACAADRTLVDGYTSAFANAGVKLKAIRIGVQALLNYVSAQPGFKDTTFVINVIDGFAMLSMVFENGINIFISRTRLYGENKEHFIRELTENLSGLVQFNSSQKFGDIKCSYYLGLSGSDLRLLRAANPHSTELNPQSGINIDALDVFGKSDDLLPNTYFAYFNALLGRDGIDLIKSCKNLKKYKENQTPKKRWAPALACAAAALMIPAGLMFKNMYDLSVGIKELKDYLSDEEITRKISELESIKAETAAYALVIGELEEKKALEAGRAPASNRALDLIAATSADKITVGDFEYDYASSTLMFTGRGPTENDAAAYVEILKKSRLIKDITYAGYRYDKNEEYAFSIRVIFDAAEVSR